MNKFSKRELAGIFIRCGIAMIIFVIAVLNYDRLSTLDVTSLTQRLGSDAQKSVAVLGIYALKSVVFVVPASLIYVAVGGIFSHVWAVVLNLAGIFLELSLTFFLGKILGRKTVTTILSKSEKGRKLLEKDLGTKPLMILGIRAVPAFPIDLVSLLYGVTGCGYFKYILFSFLGVSWRVILFTIIGNDVFKFIPMDKIILIATCMIPVGVVVYLVKKFAFSKKQNPADAGNEEESGNITDE
ncbi:MAG: TVP38/TMEM64 family protein [Clostridia bacterium]|nr:TVP38/TMEM64 family protein [Clostridia bacterium]MBR5428430.1 TVP38/TMEM64 family protein [Clostridia bacterium]